jgi:hypothetical protein
VSKSGEDERRGQHFDLRAAQQLFNGGHRGGNEER